MSKERSQPDDQFLAELAALDELLRKPVESVEPVEPVPAPPPSPSPPPAPSPAPPLASARAPTLQFDGRRRKPAEPSRPPKSPLPPRDFGLTEPEELVMPTHGVDAPRDEIVPSSPSSPRISRVGALSIAALIAGIVGGGPLGWWLAVNFFVRTPSAEAESHSRSANVPAAARPASRAATRRAGANAAAPAAVMPNVVTPDARAPNVNASFPRSRAASGTAASTPSHVDAGEVRLEATPMMSAPPPSASGAGIPSLTLTPPPPTDVPATDLFPMTEPLPSAPLAFATSVAPAAPLAVAAAGAIAAVAADERAIETTLRRYEDAYERLDANAASAIWPTVDRRALSRAFAGLASQSLDIRGCEVVVRAAASTATASCDGTAEYTRKVGDTRVRVEPRHWTFTLNKTLGAWRIEAVDGSR